jgi:hypothetical protein
VGYMSSLHLNVIQMFTGLKLYEFNTSDWHSFSRKQVNLEALALAALACK